MVLNLLFVEENYRSLGPRGIRDTIPVCERTLVTSPPRKGTVMEYSDSKQELVLEPFAPKPTLDFGTVKINTRVETALKIVNPTDADLEVTLSKPPESFAAATEFVVPARSEVMFIVAWRPICTVPSQPVKPAVPTSAATVSTSAGGPTSAATVLTSTATVPTSAATNSTSAGGPTSAATVPTSTATVSTSAGGPTSAATVPAPAGGPAPAGPTSSPVRQSVPTLVRRFDDLSSASHVGGNSSSSQTVHAVGGGGRRNLNWTASGRLAERLALVWAVINTFFRNRAAFIRGEFVYEEIADYFETLNDGQKVSTNAVRKHMQGVVQNETHALWDALNIGAELKKYLRTTRVDDQMPVTPAITEQALQLVRENVSYLPVHLQEEWKKFDPARPMDSAIGAALDNVQDQVRQLQDGQQQLAQVLDGQGDKLDQVLEAVRQPKQADQQPAPQAARQPAPQAARQPAPRAAQQAARQPAPRAAVLPSVAGVLGTPKKRRSKSSHDADRSTSSFVDARSALNGSISDLSPANRVRVPTACRLRTPKKRRSKSSHDADRSTSSFVDARSALNGSISDQSPANRVQEIQRRNSMYPRHLRSCYPSEEAVDQVREMDLRGDGMRTDAPRRRTGLAASSSVVAPPNRSDHRTGSQKTAGNKDNAN